MGLTSPYPLQACLQGCYRNRFLILHHHSKGGDMLLRSSASILRPTSAVSPSLRNRDDKINPRIAFGSVQRSHSRPRVAGCAPARNRQRHPPCRARSLRIWPAVKKRRPELARLPQTPLTIRCHRRSLGRQTGCRPPSAPIRTACPRNRGCSTSRGVRSVSALRASRGHVSGKPSQSARALGDSPPGGAARRTGPAPPQAPSRWAAETPHRSGGG